jgi:hypothetical protein
MCQCGVSEVVTTRRLTEGVAVGNDGAELTKENTKDEGERSGFNVRDAADDSVCRGWRQPIE